MPRNPSVHKDAWHRVQDNPTYWKHAVTDEIGRKIKWHSPSEECSSQVFCISAFGGVNLLPDRDEILRRLFVGILPAESRGGPWNLLPEHTDKPLLGETGQGTPTNVDAFWAGPDAIVCVESKFKFDAREGFGGCGQSRTGNCVGFYGPGSDAKTKSRANCRLEIRDGRREPRGYWTLGRKYFLNGVFRQQTTGERCPFAGPAFQLMRNFLFAATAAGDRAFGVLCIVPEKTSELVAHQVADFKRSVLQHEFQPRIGVATYDTLAKLLVDSAHEASRALGGFLRKRIDTLL